MSSQWVDTSGTPWRYSTVSQSWQRLLDGSWSPSTPPPGGLQRSAAGGARDVIVAPPWPTSECTPEGQWIDERGICGVTPPRCGPGSISLTGPG